MRISISNIAWEIALDETLANLLHKYNVDAIDIAPGKYFLEPQSATSSEIQAVKNWWEQRGIDIIGMQSLLFGTTGLNVFGNDLSRKNMLLHLESICCIASEIGATRLVFGSPKNRDRAGLNDEQASAIAVPFFRQLGEIAQQYNVIICLEPNPESYGANFMTTTSQTANIVTQVAHPAIKMQPDKGAITMNDENIESLVTQYAPLIGHIHLSEPHLAPFGCSPKTDYHRIAQTLISTLPDYPATIEMLTKGQPAPLQTIETALLCATALIRPTRAATPTIQ